MAKKKKKVAQKEPKKAAKKKVAKKAPAPKVVAEEPKKNGRPATGADNLKSEMLTCRITAQQDTGIEEVRAMMEARKEPGMDAVKRSEAIHLILEMGIRFMREQYGTKSAA